MRFNLFAASLVLSALAVPVAAQDAAKSEAGEVPKTKKVCRYTPPPTGSNRPGKRKCHTEAEWREIDREAGMIEAGTYGAPARSQPREGN